MPYYKFLATVVTCMAGLSAFAKEIPLYETGPAEDSAFIRFVNGTQAPLALTSGQAQNMLELTPEKPVSDFLPVTANRPLKGVFQQGSFRVPSETSVKPGEFVTIVAIPDTAAGMTLHTLRETPDDFNALKASMVLYNLSSQCGQATLTAAGKGVEIFSHVAAHTPSIRRAINPIKLDVQLHCNNQTVGEPVALGQLSAGERYTLFVLPANTPAGIRLYPAKDTISF